MRGRDELAIRGACSGAYYSEEDREHDTFFPWDRAEHGSATLTKARATIDRYCSECPVRKLCFDTAMETRSEGVWGGVIVTKRTKVALRRRWYEGEYPRSVITGRREDTEYASDDELMQFL